MKHIHFDIEKDGFYGAYWKRKEPSDCAIIAMLGDDPEDYMARSAVKWLIELGVNVKVTDNIVCGEVKCLSPYKIPIYFKIPIYN